MRTLEQYLPVMREADGRWYWPRSSSIGTLIAVALLLVAIAYAYRYPAMKTEEAAQRLERFNALTLQSTQNTQAALSRLQVLVADQPEWLRDLTAKQVGSLHAHLALIKPLTRTQVLQQAQAQQEEYDKAQQLIENSPFKGLKEQQIPLSVEGKAYLGALEVKRPSRFDYQRLSDGVLDALPALRAGFKLQAQAESLAHQLDLRLNGDKAAPLGLAAVTAQQAPTDLQSEESAEQAQPRFTSSVPINTLTSALRQAEKDAKRQQRQAELEVKNQQHQAEREARQAEQQAQRKQQQAKRAAAQQQRDTKRQAKAAAEAKQRAERKAERQAAAEQRQVQVAKEAKQRECTANLMARAKCAAQGYNPLTGIKN